MEENRERQTARASLTDLPMSRTILNGKNASGIRYMCTERGHVLAGACSRLEGSIALLACRVPRPGHPSPAPGTWVGLLPRRSSCPCVVTRMSFPPQECKCVLHDWLRRRATKRTSRVVCCRRKRHGRIHSRQGRIRQWDRHRDGHRHGDDCTGTPEDAQDARRRLRTGKWTILRQIGTA